LKDGRFAAHALIVLTLRGQQIAEFTVFLTPEPFVRPFRLSLALA
jgi:hypothetical protein